MKKAPMLCVGDEFTHHQNPISSQAEDAPITRSLWTRGYAVNSVGSLNLDTVRQYIMTEQEP